MLKQTYKRRRNMVLAAAATVAAVLAIAAAVLLSRTTLTTQQWETLYRQGTYFDGVTIDGIDVGGMTMEQAGAAVTARMRQRLLRVRVTIEHEGRQYVLTKDDFLTADNVDEVLKEALAAAREGSRMEIARLKKQIGTDGLAFATDYTVNPAPAKQRILEIAAAVDVPAKNATVLVNKDDRAHRFSYTDEASGYRVDQDALYAAVEQQLRTREYGVVPLPLVEVGAEVTKEELIANTVLRASAGTSFSHSPYNRASRVYNIKKAVGLINGYVLSPGEGFSTNTVLGPRTYERGWQPAPAVVRGGSEDQAGGGVCQVSSTMYNAVLKADLEIVSRQGHSIRISYVDGGLDATINTGTIDFLYANNTGHPVYIFCWVNASGQTVNFEVYGEPFADGFDEIRLSSELLETLQPDGEMLVTVDSTKPPGYQEVLVKRREGSVYATWKHYYQNGVEVKEPVLIGKTKYKAYAGEKIIGPAAPAAAQNPGEDDAEPAQEAQPDEGTEAAGGVSRAARLNLTQRRVNLPKMH